METSVEVLKEQAVMLGLTGDDVPKYVINAQNQAREERAREREFERQKLEAKEREAERQLEQKKLEAEERTREREHQLELAKLNANASKLIDHPDFASKPTLPLYREGEDIGSYLVRFERIAKLLNIHKDTYAARLGSVLTGKCVEIYASLSDDITSDYELLKKALLKGFHKTLDGYRHDFRSARLKEGETYDLFAIKLGRLFDQWIEACDVKKEFKCLRSFIVLDQLISSVSPELRTYLKENDVKDLDKAVKLADSWSSAHRAFPRASSTAVKPRKQNNQSRPLENSPQNSGASKPPQSRRGKPDYSNVTCHGCGDKGHIRPTCPKNPLRFKSNTSFSTQQIGFCLGNNNIYKHMASGTVNGAWVSTILRDTGCTCIIVCEEALPDVDVTECKKVEIADYLGRVNSFPQVRCFLRCPYYEGWADVIRAPIKFCSVMIGNVPGARNPVFNSSLKVSTSLALPTDKPPCRIEHTEAQSSSDSSEPLPNSQSCSLMNSDNKSEMVQAVQTRSTRNKKLHPLVVPSIEPLNVTPKQFSDLQQKCTSLETVRKKCLSGEKDETKDGSIFKYDNIDGLLYRYCVKSKKPGMAGKLTLVVPLECRKFVLSAAHEGLLAGHFSHRKTEIRVKEQFHWPGLTSDVRDYCRSCDKCQRMAPKGRVKPVPLKQMPIMTEPFSRVAIDLVGPLNPPSSEGHQFILTLIDFATGFPEAMPLKDISSTSVAEALITIFSRVGIPKEILSDNGAQFKSELMKELHRLLGVKPLFTTPYHPSGNGRIERFHSTLEASLRKVCEDRPKDWHRYLVPLLFAMREIPSDRTGFSAFELLYGRQVRGPLSVLRDLWEDKTMKNDDRPLYQYVLELKDKLEVCAQIAARNAAISSQKFKAYFDVKAQERKFKPGDEVLVLLPDDNRKLLLAWKGPYKVVERRNKVNYLINENGKLKLYHANLLKQYFRRAQVSMANALDEMTQLTFNDQPLIAQICVEGEDDTDSELEVYYSQDLSSPSENKELEICSELTHEQKDDVKNVIEESRDVFSELPGCTNSICHDISLCTTERLKPKLYPLPVHLQPYFENEVENLLKQGIIRPSQSPHSSPVVMIRKADGSYRMAIDYRVLNSVTEFHAEPMCNLEDDLHKFTGAKYFTELDLTKAYYQVPLTERAKPLTAFPTHKGLMEFCRLPFGLVTACATYIRLMRIVLAGLDNVSFYFDNVLIYANTWGDHIKAIRAVLERLREHGLTVKPTKCRFGFQSIKYLGFVIDGKTLRPIDDKVQTILNVSPPMTKKTLRSFLGMISFYRSFIDHASSLTSPLSDMLKKGVKEPLEWRREAIEYFEKLKLGLAKGPVLKLPDLSAPFVLRTDSSNYGLGAVLLQYVDNKPFPVAYASRKLSDRERKYSTIERECLGIIFGVKRFNYYLQGTEFILEVDHKPLIYLRKFKGNNSRLQRWALSLQPYKFRLVHIAGQDNVGADFLSRADG